MQNSRSLTIEGRLKFKVLSGVIMLLLVGLHPVRVFADAGASDTTGSNTAAVVDPSDTSTTTGAGGSSQTTTAPSTTDASNTSSSGTQQNAPSNTTSTNNTSSSAANTGSDTVAPASTSDTQTDGSTATITNQTTSSAQSGAATVSQSSTGGNATTGDAQTIATALNILSSSTDVDNDNVNTSVTNITGNSNNQNVVIDPTATDQSDDPSSSTNTQINSASSGTINNDMDLSATTGDATVSNNQVGGNATTGDATVDANILNITDSDLSSGEYYIGVINIYGDMSGNILLSPEFVSELLSENPSLLSGDEEATNNVNQTINDAITASATSGDANIANNFLGGNATSGNATTSLDTFDLINSDITGNDALLVFINVLGTWEGVIIGAPAGATTAVYGNDSTSQSTPVSSNDQTTLASSTNEVINNTIDANATSGNADVEDNFLGGNATSGNADVSVDLLNIMNSDISLSGWLGVIFINVFGNWSGDFGIVTPAVSTTTSSGGSTGTDLGSQLESLGQSIAHDAYTIFDHSSISNPTPGQVLGATTAANTNTPISSDPAARVIASTDRTSATWWMPAIAGLSLAAASLGLEQVLRKRQKS